MSAKLSAATPTPIAKADPTIAHTASPPERAAGQRAVNVSAPQTQPAESALPKSKAWWIALLIALAIVGASWFFRAAWWPRVAHLVTGSEGATPGKKKGPQERIIPVVTAPVEERDLQLYLSGLGTVTALKTVTIRSRVEGELIKVDFQEGQTVREGDLLAEIDPRSYITQRDQAAGQLARDEATLKAAQLTLDRLQTLATSKAVSTQDVDNQVALVQQTEGTIKTDKAMVANAELQLTYCKIVSPIDGRVGLRLVDKGNIVRANDPGGLVVINQLEPIAIVFTISQDDIPRVQQRMSEGEPLQVDAYNRDFSTKLASGLLMATDNQVDSTTGTLRLKAKVDKAHGAASLFPNQFVNTRLLVDTQKNALVVPSSAVQRGPDSTYVYVVNGESAVEKRDVTVGPSEGTLTSIVKGLKKDEIVVTEGIDKLQHGSKVSTRDDKAAPDGDAGKTKKAAADGSAHTPRPQASE